MTTFVRDLITLASLQQSWANMANHPTILDLSSQPRFELSAECVATEWGACVSPNKQDLRMHPRSETGSLEGERMKCVKGPIARQEGCLALFFMLFHVLCMMSRQVQCRASCVQARKQVSYS